MNRRVQLTLGLGVTESQDQPNQPAARGIRQWEAPYRRFRSNAGTNYSWSRFINSIREVEELGFFGCFGCFGFFGSLRGRSRFPMSEFLSKKKCVAPAELFPTSCSISAILDGENPPNFP